MSFIKIQNNCLYSFTSEVIKGDSIASSLGFPTANLLLKEKLNLSFGVYVGILEYNNMTHLGVISYGITPYHQQKLPKLEIHVFNFKENIYGKIVTIKFLKFIRSEKNFKSSEELIKQIEADCKIANEYFKS